EAGLPSEHPLITQVTVPALNPLDVIFDEAEEERMLQLLADQIVAASPAEILPGMDPSATPGSRDEVQQVRA
ncbi:MAG: hypothetical protein Q4F67_09865, partial [Propionibacteriaceae bacterium]|nr:hypothetical protein [Propionibacteriaceae bacterium]